MSSSFSSTLQQQRLLQIQQLQQQQQLLLFIKDGTPATFNTKWEDLHPHSQKILLQIEKRILEYRNESQRLDQSSRLHKFSVSNDGFKSDASHIAQVAGRISAALERPRILQQELTSSVKNMLCNTQMAVRSFMIQCPRFLHPSKGNALSTTAPSQTAGVPITPRLSSKQPATLVPVPDFYHGLPKKPSSFFRQTVSRFEKYLGECCRWIEELELLLKNSERNTSNNGSFSLQSLPKVMENVHDIFIHVAAKVESSIHQHMNSMRTTYLVKQRHWQEENDPSRVADQYETARKEVASKRVRLSLDLPEDSQPSTELAGLFSSSGTVGASTSPQTSPLTSNSSGSGLSVFSMPSSVPSSSLPSLCMTPTTFATVSPFSGSSSATSQTSLLHCSSSSLFGSIPSQFGSTAPSCGTTSGGSTSSSSFSLGSGTGSGARFRSKPRRPTHRR